MATERDGAVAPKRRGRPSKGKRGTFSFRVTDALRSDLEAAATKSGRPVSEEIELRLEASFRQDLVGDEPSAVLLRAVAAAIRVQELKTSSKWVDGGECARRAFIAAITVLDAIIMPEAVEPANKLLGPSPQEEMASRLERAEARSDSLDVAMSEMRRPRYSSAT